jgi:hypothetical protein
MNNAVLKIGSLAFFDSVRNGLVPCRVTDITRDSDGNARISAVVTATRGAYPKGYALRDFSTWSIVPRDAVYRPRDAFFPRIRSFTVEG